MIQLSSLVVCIHHILILKIALIGLNPLILPSYDYWRKSKHTFKGLTLPYPRVKLCGRTPTFLLASFFACIRMWYTTFVMFSYGTGSRNYRNIEKAVHVRLLDSGCMSNFLTESCWSNHRFLNICIYLICTKNKGFSREANRI